MSNDSTQPWPDLLDALQPGIEPETPEAEQFPCPHCDRVFPSANALGGHLSSKHTQRQGKVPCPECGQRFMAGVGIASHRARVHGVAGTSRTPEARDRKRTRDKELRAEKKTKTAEKRVTEILAHEWDVDDIFEVVVATMWPEGTLPVRAVVPLYAWREATRQLLESLNSQT